MVMASKLEPSDKQTPLSFGLLLVEVFYPSGRKENRTPGKEKKEGHDKLFHEHLSEIPFGNSPRYPVSTLGKHGLILYPRMGMSGQAGNTSN